MTNFSDDLKKQASIIRLTDTERESIRARIFGEPVAAPARSPYVFTFSYFSYSRGLAVALSLVLVVTGAGGTLYAAEGTLPGDVLYTIKTGVAEPISGVLAISEEAKTSWHETIATKRLTEAEALAREGRLTDDVSAKLAVAFETHAAKVRSADSDDSSALTSEANEVRTEVRASAKERFRSLVAAKGASILEASVTGDGTSGRIASAHFVLSVLDDEQEDQGDDMDRGALMTKESAALEADVVAQDAAPMMATMAFMPPAPPGETTNAKQVSVGNQDDLETLGKDAKRAFEEARKVVAEHGSPELTSKLSRLLPTLVRADAEAVTGADMDARAHYAHVIENARAINALFSQDDDRGSGEREHEDHGEEAGDSSRGEDDEYRSFFDR